ncbi:MAG: crotonase/enoyl-CoA hydratase family protein [Microthrixaceae bacterium]
MAMTTTLEVSHEGPVAHVRLCRPDELNTMNAAFWSELPEVVDEIDRTGETRAMVLSSTGRHFSAGMDLGVFSGSSVGVLPSDAVAEEGRRRAQIWMLVQHLQESFNCLERARFPVLAAIQGGCIGGAVDMVCAADMRYATADAFFCIQEINIGMTADLGTLQRLPKLVPEGLARELAYTGDRMPASRAREIGLVNEVFTDHDEMLGKVMDVAERIAKRSPLAIWGTKEMVNFGRDHGVGDSLRYMAAWQSGMFQPGDMMEEFGARAERRDPSFERNPRRV